MNTPASSEQPTFSVLFVLNYFTPEHNLFKLCISLDFFFKIDTMPLHWPSGRVVMQRTANPSIPVRFRSRPPLLIASIVLVRGVGFLCGLSHYSFGLLDPPHVWVYVK